MRELVAGAQTPAFAKVLTKLATMVEDGNDLATAMARLPAWFEPAYLPLVERAAEQEALPETLGDLARLARFEADVTVNYRAAYARCLALTAVALVIAGYIYYYPVPILQQFLYGMRPPFPTRLAFAMASFCRACGPGLLLLPGLFLAAAVLIGLGSRGMPGCRLIAGCSFGARRACRNAELARLCALLASFLRHNLPLAAGLEAAAPSASSRKLRRCLKNWQAAAHDGADLVGLVHDNAAAPRLLRLAVEADAPGGLAERLEQAGGLYAELAMAERSKRLTAFRALPVIILLVLAGVSVLGYFATWVGVIISTAMAWGSMM